MINNPPIVEKKKRGRKPNAEKYKNMSTALPSTIVNEIGNILMNNVDNELFTNNAEIKVPKKRGRKPKGGKIIEVNKIIDNKTMLQSNVILHLKCNTVDNIDYINSDMPESFKFNENKYNELDYNYLIGETKQFNTADQTNHNVQTNNASQTNNADIANQTDNADNSDDSKKTIWKKIDELTINLHNNNISDNKSACFWCTVSFDNPPIFIPKYEFNNSYHVYGCFCSPECASAFLINENIDSATKFERYHLLNFIYSKIYDYTKNIKPAPNPYYTLDKYYGNLNIQEYRQLLKNERLLLIVEKPLTRMLPELHEDNDEFMLNTNYI